jgi:ABC-2 type transport system ATP-binding protein
MTIALQTCGLGKDYGNTTALHALDLTVDEGEIVGLLGPNGAGKTTAISVIAGVMTPTRGTVKILGRDVHADSRAARVALGVVPQDLALYEQLTARQNLAFFGSLYQLRGDELRERIAWTLDLAQLASRADDRVETYSGGMKRRLNLAVGLLHRPRVLILDEPTVGVDPQSRSSIFDTIEQLRRVERMTVLYTSHYMEEVERLCDRTVILDRGRVVEQGSIAELIGRHTHGTMLVELFDDAAAYVQQLAPLGDVAAEGKLLRVGTTLPISRVVHDVEATGAAVRSIRSLTGDLEAVFLAVTGRELRDS